MSKFHNLLGFAQKAGKLVSGEQAVETGIRRQAVHFLIIAGDSSDNTKRKFVAMAKNYEVPYETCDLKEELGRVIGKPRRAVIGVCDKGFAKSLQKALGEKN